MRINQKMSSTLVILFSVITICLAILSFLNYANIDIMMIFLGITQLFAGLNQINMEQHINSKGISKGNKKVGIFLVIIGMSLLLLILLKWLYSN